MSDGRRELQQYRAFALAQAKCLAFGHTAQPGSICFCVGPGGAGKTSLARSLGRLLYDDSGTWSRGIQPYVYVEADLADRGYFSPKWFIRECLAALMDPFRASPEEVTGWDLDSTTKLALLAHRERIARPSMSEPEMRKAFISVAQLREVRMLIVDEANLLVLTQKGRRPTDYLESIRRLGDQIGCGVILFGTVRLLELLGYSAQLNRRTDYVHLDRMRCEGAEGEQEFLGFLRGIESDFSLKTGALSTHAAEVFDATYGIPGEVIGLVERADRLRSIFGEPATTWSHLVQARQRPVALEQMRREADFIREVLEGEKPRVDPAPKATRRGKVGRPKPRRFENGAT